MKHILGKNTTSSIVGVPRSDVQPNAVDLRIQKVIRISSDPFVLKTTGKAHRTTEELKVNYILDNENVGWDLRPGAYEITMQNIVKVGENEAGWIIPRSTLVRNGVFLASGLYDSGFHGTVGCCMHVTCGNFILERGAPVAQFILFDAEMAHMYNGSYGFGKESEKKYSNDNEAPK